MEGMTWKKLALGLGIFMLVLGLPFFLMSNCMLDYYQGKIEADPNSDFSKWLQLKVGGISYHTMRSERAVKAYETYIERYKEDEQRPFAMLRWGRSLEDCNRFNEAIEAYEIFLAEYPTHELAEAAEKGIKRIKYQIPNK